MYKPKPFTFGGGMRFNTNNVSNKPPSRAASKKVRKRSAMRRLDSASRMRNTNNSNKATDSYKGGSNKPSSGYRMPGSSSLSRTSGKRASRIIIRETTDTLKEKQMRNGSSYKKNELPQNILRDIKPVDSLKDNINQMFNSSVKRPSGITTNPTSSLYGNSTGTSNFSSKIRVNRDSTEASTRAEEDYKKPEVVKKSKIEYGSTSNDYKPVYLSKVAGLPNIGNT
mmetsp:Transcript_4033/g.3814  ORF Transcript_4033/g.3814 Transcript_4033/m.3814 type:complete len:225 (-) Transcript_4033:1046-1720(-)|eukprot:CAMPEP_0197016164 /NCGR_PEP_ID=MMETSP1380-20130617/77130_1 /TAXON_ID=5936 /ORGANISM="Euplotes crassus, Strain CT5" /LENGTH=224 /DNA_ID=CAMNT_0042442707 /DNA_START=25 /DNA_END=699 /DNA_ORIENTATION=-